MIYFVIHSISILLYALWLRYEALHASWFWFAALQMTMLCAFELLVARYVLRKIYFILTIVFALIGLLAEFYAIGDVDGFQIHSTQLNKKINSESDFKGCAPASTFVVPSEKLSLGYAQDAMFRVNPASPVGARESFNLLMNLEPVVKVYTSTTISQCGELLSNITAHYALQVCDPQCYARRPCRKECLEFASYPECLESLQSIVQDAFLSLRTGLIHLHGILELCHQH